MSVTSRTNLQYQKGVFPLVVIIIVVVVAVVGIAGTNLMRKTTQQQSQTLQEGWQTFKSDKYGYSVSYPKDWKVEDKSTETSRKVSIFDPKGNAYVDVSAFKDDSMKDAAAIQTAISAMETKLKNNPTLKVLQFKGQSPKSGEKIGGYIAAGEETIKGIVFNFDNRGLFDIYGKIILFHSAAKKELAKDYSPILEQIVKNFKVK